MSACGRLLVVVVLSALAGCSQTVDLGARGVCAPCEDGGCGSAPTMLAPTSLGRDEETVNRDTWVDLAGAFDGEGYLTVWVARGGYVMASRQGSDGRPLGRMFQVGQGVGAPQVAAAWAGTSYLVAWSSDTKVLCATVSRAGAVGAPQELTSGSAPVTFLSAAGAQGAFVVAWVTSGGFFYRLIDEVGAARGGVTKVDPLPGGSVASNGHDFLLVGAPVDREFLAFRLAPDGTLGAPLSLPVRSPIGEFDVAFDGERYAIGWSSFRSSRTNPDGGIQLITRRVDAMYLDSDGGTAPAGGAPLSTRPDDAGLRQQQLALAADDAGLHAVWFESEYYDLRSPLIGTTRGTGDRLLLDDVTTFGLDLTAGGPAPLAHFGRDMVVQAAFLQPDGTLSSPSPLTLAANPQLYPWLGVGPSASLVGWLEPVDSSLTFELWYTWVSPLDDTQLSPEVSLGLTSSAIPSVASDGDRHLVAWPRRAGSQWELTAQFFSPGAAPREVWTRTESRLGYGPAACRTTDGWVLGWTASERCVVQWLNDDGSPQGSELTGGPCSWMRVEGDGRSCALVSIPPRTGTPLSFTPLRPGQPLEAAATLVVPPGTGRWAATQGRWLVAWGTNQKVEWVLFDAAGQEVGRGAYELALPPFRLDVVAFEGGFWVVTDSGGSSSVVGVWVSLDGVPSAGFPVEGPAPRASGRRPDGVVLTAGWVDDRTPGIVTDRLRLRRLLHLPEGRDCTRASDCASGVCDTTPRAPSGCASAGGLSHLALLLALRRLRPLTRRASKAQVSEAASGGGGSAPGFD